MHPLNKSLLNAYHVPNTEECIKWWVYLQMYFYQKWEKEKGEENAHRDIIQLFGYCRQCLLRIGFFFCLASR